MGKLIIQVSLGLSFVVVLASIVCCAIPFHKKAFSTLGSVPVFTISTYPMTIKIDFWCAAILWPFDNQWCYDLEGTGDLESISQRFCAVGIEKLFPSTCPGLKNAWGLGLAMALCVFTNAVLVGIASFLTYQYMIGSPKKQYRKVALMLMVIGAGLLSSVLLAYIPFVILFLDDTRSSVPGLQLLVSGSNATGVSKGYIFMWVCVILQLLVVSLQKFTKTSNETRYAEAREHEKFMAEMQMYNQAALASQGPGAQMPGAGPAAYYIGSGHPGLNSGQMQQQQQYQANSWGGPPQFAQQADMGGGWNGPQQQQRAW